MRTSLAYLRNGNICVATAEEEKEKGTWASETPTGRDISKHKGGLARRISKVTRKLCCFPRTQETNNQPLALHCNYWQGNNANSRKGPGPYTSVTRHLHKYHLTGVSQQLCKITIVPITQTWKQKLRVTHFTLGRPASRTWNREPLTPPLNSKSTVLLSTTGWANTKLKT